MHKGINTTADEGQTPIITHGGGFDGADVAHALRGEGFDASEDGTGRGTPIVPVQHAIAIQERAVSENPDAGPDGKGWRDDGAAYTLEARQQPQAVVAGTICKDSFSGGAGGRPEGAASGHFQPIAFTAKDHGGDAVEGISPTLRAGGHTGSHANAGVMPAIAFQPRIGRNGRGYEEGVCPSLNGADAGATSDMRPCVAGAAWGVRRLTPTECARLQGFPDDWARIPWRGKPAEECPDGPQYKSYGNSMACNVMGWIGERIEAVRAADERQD